LVKGQAVRARYWCRLQPGVFEVTTYDLFSTTAQTHLDDEPFMILSP
jgi:hypothetical protein